MEAVRDRCAGLLWGLAAGDKNGGPIRMATLLAESLLEQKQYDNEDVIKRYNNWYSGKDNERCFDTGNTFVSVFELMEKGKTNADAAQMVYNENKILAGVNAAHRCSPISMAGFISDAGIFLILPISYLSHDMLRDIKEITTCHTKITHLHPISAQVAVVVNEICRNLIKGTSWEQSIETAKKITGLDEIVVRALSDCDGLDPGGYAPAVLQAAIHFMNSTATPDLALKFSLRFAKASNFCPVLVGAFCGAKWGKYKLVDYCGHELDHCSKNLIKRVGAAATGLANTWN